MQVFRAAIIRSTQSPNGSAGTYQYMDAMAENTKAEAMLLAPVGNPLDRRHDKKPVGEYKRSFKFDRVGSNGSKLRRAVYNTVPYAGNVELGRSSTKSSRYSYANGERYSTKYRGGRIVFTFGTKGWKGKHVLEHALWGTMAKSSQIAGTTFAQAVAGTDYATKYIRRHT